MARDLTSSVVAEVQSQLVHPFLLFEGDFVGGYVRCWTGVGNLTWGGYTWTGVGTLAGVSAIEETTEVAAKQVTVSLSGIPSANVSLALGASRQGKLGRVYLGFLDSSGNVVADPYLAFTGRLDVPVIEDMGEAATITITYESRLVALQRAPQRRYTHEDQQLDYAGDMGLEYVSKIQDAQITWGTK